MPDKKKISTLYFLPIKPDCAIRADVYGQRVWPGASAYGLAPKHVGRAGMPDGPPCLWGFDSDFQTHFVRKRVKISEQNIWFK